jgi:hypothetical protein
MPLAVALAMASLDRPTSGVVRAMDDVPRLRQAGVR